MHDRTIAAIALGATLLSLAPARAFDDAMYPDLKGAWHRAIEPGPRFDQSKPPGRGQGAPMTAEYNAIFEANLKDMAEGGQGDFTTWACLASGVPMMMNVYEPMEIIVLPEITYIRIDVHTDAVRRIFTDGRDWPKDPEPAFVGYSIGKWLDTTGSGHYDTLEVETRDFKGPRAYDNSGRLLDRDNQSVINERIFLDKADRNTLHDEITVNDNALTRPWTVLKTYKRDPSSRPYWREEVCQENNPHVKIGGQIYMLSADGYLMPQKKGQQPPDLRYFNAAKN